MLRNFELKLNWASWPCFDQFWKYYRVLGTLDVFRGRHALPLDASFLILQTNFMTRKKEAHKTHEAYLQIKTKVFMLPRN